ncbi:conjugal transfer pilus assembly protein TraW [Providencia alcalifaciens]|uniref:Conjugal transfer pilus assembly protein TraW n=1 Tax=Providencia alcalifaciens TaxID=126385 RepID=A0A4R3NFV3_9GAMM|nr:MULTISPECIES: type-F conjugative transfer system protein TraW [Providencia]MBC5792296.1 type-F conjugative transfer system protein TraW [Providencia sp. JUb39]TCT28880.1 conjugal transfer pilus assembly protein TraW [Providencia alcalifaciens]
MKRLRLFPVALLLCVPVVGIAKDLGVWGDVYPVQEQSMLAFIQNRLKQLETTGEIAQMQQDFKDRVIENTLRPPFVEGLLTDTESHTLWYDPTFTVQGDYADHQGVVFARHGDRINPLSMVGLGQTLYFLDADDPRQVAWMNAQTPPTLRYKVILTNGNIKTATEQLNTRIYFDQAGSLTRQLGIQYIPAVVTQEGEKLKIVSAPMKEER